MWDTAGQERFSAITQGYYHRADAVVLVYDISRTDTLKNLKEYWLKEVKKHAKEDVHHLVVGNKSDLRDKKKQKKEERKAMKESEQERKEEEEKGTMEPEMEENKVTKEFVTKESGKQFSEEEGIPFMETSARDWDTINELFVQLAKRLLEKKPAPHGEEKDIQEASDTKEGSDTQKESDTQKGSDTQEGSVIQEASDVQKESAIQESSTDGLVVLDQSKSRKKRRKKWC